jgi:hypothetical protein
MKFKKEKEEIENALQKAIRDHQLDVKQKKPAKKFKYNLCDIYVESGVELGQHFRRNHYKDQVCQTSECETSDEPSKFEYPCFYCGYMISSAEELQKHVTECISLSEEVEFPCNVCETSFISMVELEHHIIFYHYEWELPDEPIFNYEFPCDVCDTNCRSKVKLEEHIRAYHYTFYTEADLQTCDFCGLKFGTLGGLRSHIRGLHKEMLPT